MVPCYYNTGKPVRTKHHKEWDKVVEGIAGGLTIYRPSLGKWKDKDNTSYHERVIPVRIACTENQIAQIAKFSLKHYRQIAVLVYKISDEVKIFRNEESHEEGEAGAPVKNDKSD